MNWRIITGILLLLGTIRIMIPLIMQYQSGKLAFWPFGTETIATLVFFYGFYLIRKGIGKIDR